MVAISLLDRFSSDQFLFWSAIFIVAAFLLCFILGVFLGIFQVSKNTKELEEHFGSLFGFSVFQGIYFVTVLFYIVGIGEGSHDKTETVSICFLNALFVGTFCMITPLCVWLFYFVNEIFALFGLIIGSTIKNIVGCIFKKKSS